MKKIFVLVFILTHCISFAQDQQTYQQPPAIMRELLLAPTTPTVNLDSKGEWMLIMDRSSYPTIAELAEPELRIAGLRINPENFSASRVGSIIKITLRNILTKTDYNIQGLPDDLHAINFQWSPDETQFAFMHIGNNRVDLYVVNIAARSAQKINTAALNAIPAFYAWVGNNKLVYKTVPANIKPFPGKMPAPAGPVVQESLGKQGAARTYQDLIKSPYDEELFAYMTTSQLVINDLKTERPIGQPDIYSSISVSPDNQYLLVTQIEKPFSYLIPYNGFPQRISVMDMNGLIIRILARNPSTEGAPIGFDDVSERPRNFQWRNDEPSTVFFVQAVDKGLGPIQK